jgi:cyanophycinase
LGGARAAEVGPASGALVLVGGALQDPAIVGRFLELAGGPEAAIVAIPTAAEAGAYAGHFAERRLFQDAGARRIRVLHTRDRAEADSEAFVRPLREAGGVWFSGGRQWRLADAYLGTRTHRELLALLARGGVVGGSSAGATIQGSFLVRGDTAGNTLMIGDHVRGFGLLRDVAVDQHLLKRNRHFDLVEVIEARPELPGIGLDEDTAIVVEGDRFEVLGRGYVAIYDARAASPRRFYFLAAGDRYDLARREPQRADPSAEPFRQFLAGRAPR